MANVAPPLDLAVQVRRSLDNGKPLRVGVREYLTRASDQDDFKKHVAQWLWRMDNRLEEPESTEENAISSAYRRSILLLLESGFRGLPILEPLKALEAEIESAMLLELQKELDQLPYKLMIPLFLFIFPAFLLLLLGPITVRLVEQLNNSF